MVATVCGLDYPGIELDSKFSVPVQTGPEAHPASCKSGRSLKLTTHPF
jgi:hypothetical protein